MVTDFQKRVYALCKKVPKGKATTYKAIAKKMGIKAYRAVGMALNKNPFSDVPCHRVVGSNGHLTGFASGLRKKEALLRKEGIKVRNFRVEEFERVLV
ncbi:MGMT family protein [Candidatus Woesearchaeota archaeon]|nr:MGMT family protein [Candidatus Woesearchaeota archaeon]